MSSGHLKGRQTNHGYKIRLCPLWFIQQKGIPVLFMLQYLPHFTEVSFEGSIRSSQGLLARKSILSRSQELSSRWDSGANFWLYIIFSYRMLNLELYSRTTRRYSSNLDKTPRLTTPATSTPATKRRRRNWIRWYRSSRTWRRRSQRPDRSEISGRRLRSTPAGSLTRSSSSWPLLSDVTRTDSNK